MKVDRDVIEMVCIGHVNEGATRRNPGERIHVEGCAGGRQVHSQLRGVVGRRVGSARCRCGAGTGRRAQAHRERVEAGMSAAITMRALVAVNLGERRALPGQIFTTNGEHAARLLKQGAAVVCDERDIARIAGREHDLQHGSHRRVRGHIGGRS
jgi:hypothetical protein